jgi:MFS family permease
MKIFDFFITSLLFGPIVGAGVGASFLSFKKVLFLQILIQVGTVAALFFLCKRFNILKARQESVIIQKLDTLFEIKKRVKVSQNMLKQIEKNFQKRKGISYFGFYISVALMTFLIGIPLVFLAVFFLRLPKKKSFLAMSIGAVFASYIWTSAVFGSLTFVGPDQVIVFAISFIFAGMLFSKLRENKLIKETIREILG